MSLLIRKNLNHKDFPISEENLENIMGCSKNISCPSLSVRSNICMFFFLNHMIKKVN